MKLQDRVALVTGAASGIGQAVAVRFAAEGAAVMAADTDDKNGRETVEGIRAAGGRAEFFHLDVSIADQVRRAVQQTIDSLGGLHILFNGAGILAYGTAVETPEQLWKKIMAVNLTGTFLCSQACLPHMIAQGKGSALESVS